MKVVFDTQKRSDHLFSNGQKFWKVEDLSGNFFEFDTRFVHVCYICTDRYCTDRSYDVHFCDDEKSEN